MALSKQKKEKFVSEYQQAFSSAGLVVITQQVGLSADEVADLRKKMQAAGARYKVTKNTLAKMALKGTPYEQLDAMFEGPTAIAVSADPIAAAKVAVDFANQNEKLKIVGGAMGANTLNAAGVKQLATLPSLDELRGRLIGLIQAPATKIAGVLQAPAGQLARVFGAYSKKES